MTTNQFTQAQFSEHHKWMSTARKFAFDAIRMEEMTFEEGEEFCDRKWRESIAQMERESNS